MLSHVVGPVTDPLLDETIGRALEIAASRWGNLLAVIDCGQDVRLSWSELNFRVDDFRKWVARYRTPASRQDRYTFTIERVDRHPCWRQDETLRNLRRKGSARGSDD